MSKKTAKKTATKAKAKTAKRSVRRERSEVRGHATQETVVVPLLVAIPKDAAKTVGAGLVVTAPEAMRSVGNVTQFTPTNHPMRRATDKLSQAADSNRGAKQSVTRETQDSVAAPQTTQSAAGLRGRVAGRYVATKKQPAKFNVYTNSIKQVHQFVLRHKRGVAMKNIAERLEMPLGTVGWALRWLMKQNAVAYQAAAQPAAA